AAVLLVYRLAGSITRAGRESGGQLETGSAFQSSVAFVAAALFAVHPITTESVCWIAAQKDLIAADFGLVALCAAFGSPGDAAPVRLSSSRLVGIALAWLAAMLAKENAFLLIFPLAAIRWVYRDAATPRREAAWAVSV